MARGAAADTATSEFYVNLKDNPALDYVSATAPGYAVFGRIKDGMPVVDAMATMPTGPVSGLLNVPLSEVVLMKPSRVFSIVTTASKCRASRRLATWLKRIRATSRRRMQSAAGSHSSR